MSIQHEELKSTLIASNTDPEMAFVDTAIGGATCSVTRKLWRMPSGEYLFEFLVDGVSQGITEKCSIDEAHEFIERNLSDADCVQLLKSDR